VTRGQGNDPPRVEITASCDEDNNDKGTGDSDEELIAAAERDFKHQARQPVDHFEKLLEAMFPNYMYPVRHKLKE
jgi:hypothetical protein